MQNENMSFYYNSHLEITSYNITGPLPKIFNATYTHNKIKHKSEAGKNRVHYEHHRHWTLANRREGQ